MERSKVVKLFFILAVLFIMPKKADAQIIEVGASAEMSYYIGDLNPQKHFSQSQFGFGAVVRYYDNLRWAFRLQYSHYNLQSTDQVNFGPNKGEFNNAINDIAVLAEFNFFDYWTGSKQNFISPYIFGGVSLFNYYYNQPTNNSEYGTEKSNNISFSIPFGVGVKYSMTKRLGTTLEWRMHKLMTDKIDEVSFSDKDMYKFGYNNDWIGTLELSLVYRFNLPRKDACHSGIKARF
jgi:hypothetical protein